MNLFQAVGSAFTKNFARFSGRASRSEYWWFALFMAVGAFIVLIIADQNSDPTPLFIFLAITLLPQLSLAVRRLHDRDMSGWYVLIALIPYVGALIFLFMIFPRGTIGQNQYGEDPI